MYINLNTTFTQEQLETDWDIVETYYDNIVAYRSKHPNGLLRIIDTDSGHDILEFVGNPHTDSIADAKAKADKIMNPKRGEMNDE
jgi:hypothetical protein